MTADRLATPFAVPSSVPLAGSLAGTLAESRAESLAGPGGPRAAAGCSPRSACRRARRQAGQGMTEYIIIVGLIAVAAIGIYTLFGQTIRNQTAGLALEVSGQDAASAISNAQGNASTASTNANQRKGLDNYNLANR